MNEIYRVKCERNDCNFLKDIHDGERGKAILFDHHAETKHTEIGITRDYEGASSFYYSYNVFDGERRMAIQLLGIKYAFNEMLEMQRKGETGPKRKSIPHTGGSLEIYID